MRRAGFSSWGYVAVLGAGVVATLIVLLVLLARRDGPARASGGVSATPGPVPWSATLDREPASAGPSLPAVVYSCAQCHALPPPDALARDDWPRVIERINTVVAEYALGEPLSPDALRQAIGYYVDHAPTSLPPIPPPEGAAPVAFVSGAIGRAPTPPPGGKPPILGVLSVASIASPRSRDILVPDIGENRVSLVTRVGSSFTEINLADVPAPCVASPADMDGDGDVDVLVASLGQMMPTDEPVGSIHLMENVGRGQFERRTILDRLSRVADAQPADLDGDGDLDVLFAAFGLYATGEIGWLEQTSPGTFAYRAIHSTNGATHVRPADFDGDGLVDFVALVSQQHEVVLLFRNLGGGRFESSELHRAPHPLWGFSSLSLVDLDGDGDLDVVVTNGDALDQTPSPKPYHGVAWLENLGGLKFEHRRLADVPGAYCAAAADFDLDGDIDLVVTSMMNDWSDPACQALTMLVNDGAQGFTARPMSNSPAWQVSCVALDLNEDGRPDVVSAGMYVMPPFARVGRLAAFVNAGPQP